MCASSMNIYVLIIAWGKSHEFSIWKWGLGLRNESLNSNGSSEGGLSTDHSLVTSSVWALISSETEGAVSKMVRS